MNPVKIIPVNTVPVYEVRIFEADDAQTDCDAAISPARRMTVATQAAREVSAFLDAENVSAGQTAAVAAVPNTSEGPLPRLFILTDETVNALYGDAFSDALGPCRDSAVRFVVPAGETSKSLSFYGQALERLAAEGFTRSDVLIALGGGVVGDLGGFVAATYLRGIRFIQVPTTLLACVDSSVGGKTAVNLAAGKNLAGAFHQPSLVVIHEGFLSTLSDDLLRDGLAEAIKCGVIGDASLLGELESLFAAGPSAKTVGFAEGPAKTAAFEGAAANGTAPAAAAAAPAADSPVRKVLSPAVLTRVISAAITLKKSLVEEDERDTGARQLLNLGHTIGHAIEGASGFTVSHGHAVASGMYLCAKAACARGWSEEDLGTRLGALLSTLGYKPVYPYDAGTLYTYIMKDKKRAADTITLVVPVAAGKSVLKKIPVSELPAFLADALAGSAPA